MWGWGLKEDPWRWLLRIHSKMHLYVGCRPAFTFPTNRLLREKLVLHFFSSPPFSTFFPSSKMTSLISAALRARVHFPQALACHTSTCLPAHVTVCAAVQGWGLASPPCAPITFSTDFARILSLLTGFLLRLFLLTNTLVRLDKAQCLSKRPSESVLSQWEV